MKSILTFLVFHIATLAFSQTVQVNGFSARVSLFGPSYLFFTPLQNAKKTDLKLSQISALSVNGKPILPEAIRLPSTDNAIVLAVNHVPESQTLQQLLPTLQELAEQTSLRLIVRGVPEVLVLPKDSDWQQAIGTEHDGEGLRDFVQRVKKQKRFQSQRSKEAVYQRLWVAFVTNQIHADLLEASSEESQSWQMIALEANLNQELQQHPFFPIQFAKGNQNLADKILALQERAKKEVALLYRIPPFMYGGHSLNFFIHWQDLGSQPIEVMLQPPSISGLKSLSHLEWGAAFIVGVALILLTLKPKPKTPANQKGFMAVSPHMKISFVPMTSEHQSLDFLNQMPLKKGIRLSANLNKVHINHDKGEVFLEDTNVKNALLINRRRIRRRSIRSGDVFDIGDVFFIFLSDQEQKEQPKPRTAQAVPLMKFRPTKHPLPFGTGLLINQRTKQEYPLTKNITFIGQSEENDLTIFAPNLSLYHAKIQKVGTQYKLQNVNSNENIYVNRRRVDYRYLREGDEISLNGYFLKFRVYKMSVALQARSRHAISSQHAI